MPRYHNGLDSSLMYGDCASQLFPGAGPRIFAVREPAILAESIPDFFSITAGSERGLVSNFDTGRFERRDGPLTVPGLLNRANVIAIEEDALHRSRRGKSFAGLPVEIAVVDPAAKVAAICPKPPEHVFPGKQNGDGDTLLRGILRMPAINGYGITRFLVVVGKNGRKLLKNYVSGKLVPAIIEPRLGIERSVVTSSNGIIPLPGAERVILRMVRGEDLGDAFPVLRLLIHRKLISIHDLIFMNAALQVPAGEIAPVSSRESSGTKTPDGRALPVTVIDVAGIQRRFFCAGMLQRGADGALPCGFGDIVARAGGRCCHEEEENEAIAKSSACIHEASGKLRIAAIGWQEVASTVNV